MGAQHFQALIVVWIGYSAFTFYAGSQGVVITDTIMFVLFAAVACLALGYVIAAGGGGRQRTQAGDEIVAFALPD